MDVSIVIINFNTEKLLKQCLTSVFDLTKNLAYEVIVVDNNSKDSPRNMLLEFFPSVIFIQSNNNCGFGKANNLGASYATGKYLFLLNSDTILLNNAIKILFDFKESDIKNEVGACGGNLFMKNLSPNFSYSLYYPSLWSIVAYRLHLNFMLNNEVFNNSQENKEVSIIIGADLFIETKLFNDLEGFDHKFFMYVEDGELQLRIMKRNLKIFSIPSARIIHLQGSSSSTFFKMKTEFDSYFYYFKKHFGTKHQLYYKNIELVSNLIKLIYFSLTKKSDKIEDYSKFLKYIYARK